MKRILVAAVAAFALTAGPAVSQSTPPTYEELEAQVASLTVERDLYRTSSIDLQDRVAYLEVDLRVANDEYLIAAAAAADSKRQCRVQTRALRSQIRAERAARRAYVANVKRFINRIRAQFLTPRESRVVAQQLHSLNG